MRILVLAMWWPEPAINGITLRTSNLVRALAKEHEVSLLALVDGPPAVGVGKALAGCASTEVARRRPRQIGALGRLAGLLGPLPASVYAGWDAAFAELVRERAATLAPEIVVCFELGAAAYGLAAPGAPLVLESLESGHMAEQVNARGGLRRARRLLMWWKHRRYVARLLRRYALCTVVSEAERALASTMAPAGIRLAVVPNGADVAGCRGDWGAPEPDTLIYAGSVTYGPNYDAVRFFLAEVLPLVRARRPKARLIVTGAITPALHASLAHLEGAEFTGLVPDVRPLVARAWAEVVPLRSGSGTRLKVLEALALGTPVIATTKGVEGLAIGPGEGLLVADDAPALAGATLRLLEDSELRARLAAAGRAAVAEHYDWEAIGRSFVRLVSEVATRRRETVAV